MMTQSFPGMDRSASVTERQSQLLAEYHLSTPPTRGEASDAIQAHENAHPELATARKTRAQEKRRQTLAARHSQGVSPEDVEALAQSANPALDSCALASRMKAEKTGKPAA